MANVSPIHQKWLMSALFIEIMALMKSALFIEMANVSPIHRNG